MGKRKVADKGNLKGKLVTTAEDTAIPIWQRLCGA